MADLRIRIEGLKEAEATLAKLNGGAKAVGGIVVRVGTAVKYAWGIHFGRTRSGRLARRAGGAFFLTNALEQVKPLIEPALEKALPEGAQATTDALMKLGYRVEAGAKERVPVKTGNLRRSLHTSKGPR